MKMNELEELLNIIQTLRLSIQTLRRIETRLADIQIGMNEIIQKEIYDCAIAESN